MEYRGKVDKVIFTSGEPTLNRNLLKYIQEARSYGYKEVGLTTNGRLLSYEKFATGLVLSGVTEIIISIHGHNPKIHDAMTRSKGSFDNTLEGIRNVSRLSETYPVKLLLATTLTKLNYRYFGEIMQFLNSFNCSEVICNVVQPVKANMEKYFDRLMPRYSDLAEEIERFYENNKEVFYENGNMSGRRRISIIDLPCCLSRVLAEVMGYGEIRVIERFNMFDSKDKNMEVIVHNDNMDEKLKREECCRCVYGNYCGGVYVNYIKHFGWDEFKPVTAS